MKLNPLLVALSGIALTTSEAAIISSTFTGAAANRGWSTSANWNPGFVPRNDDTDQFDATIPADNVDPVLYNLSGDTFLNSLTINSASIVHNTGADRSLTLLGDLVNEGQFEITRIDQSNALLFEDEDDFSAEINGSGIVRLRQGAEISGGGSEPLMLIHGAGHTIEGDGFVGRDSLESMRNEGLILANVSNRRLRLSLANSLDNQGTIKSSNGGDIHFLAGTINGSAGAKFEIGDASSFTLSNSTFLNLTFEPLDLNADPTDHTLDIESCEFQEVIVDLSSTLSAGRSLTINHVVENNGAMIMEQGGGFLDETKLIVGTDQAGSVTLRGSGSMRFEASSEVVLEGLGSPTFIQESDHAFLGQGSIEKTVRSMINRGSIIADDDNRNFSIECEDSFANEGLVRAEGGGNLRFSNGDFSQSPTGRYEVADSSSISLLSSVGMIGVTFDPDDQNDDLSDNLVEVRSAHLENVVFNVDTSVRTSSTTVLDRITNNARMSFSGAASFNRGLWILGSDTSTETVFGGTGNMNFDSRFYTFEGAEGAEHTLINESGHTIEGAFSASTRIASFINRGTLRSSLSNQNITAIDVDLKNEGLLELVNSGRLNLGSNGLLTNRATLNVNGRLNGAIFQTSGETNLLGPAAIIQKDVEAVGGTITGIGELSDTLLLGTPESLPGEPPILVPGLPTGQLEITDGLICGLHSLARFEVQSQADFGAIITDTDNNNIGLNGNLNQLELSFTGDLQNLPSEPITLIDANIDPEFQIGNVTNGSRLTTTDGNVSFRVTWPTPFCTTDEIGLQISEARLITGGTNASHVTDLLTKVDGPFPGETDPAIIGFNADPDGDKLGNIFELWMGLDPATPDANPLLIKVFPREENGSEFITLEVSVSSAMDNLFDITGKLSNELVNFRDGVRTVVSDDGSTRIIRFCDTFASPSGKGFARLIADPNSPR